MLEKLKVVELASVLAGPAVGLFFAELGAEVIKIENKTTQGDMTRRWKLPNEDKDSTHSAYFHSVNWHKKSLFMDLRTEADRIEVQKLIQSADIVVANYRKGAAKKLGMDYETLKKTNPKLIYANITAFGEDDNTPGFDVVLQAETGFLYMNGEPDRNPVRMPVALIDILTAHQLKEGILLALIKRMQTGKGSYVSATLVESAIASLANQASNWLNAGFIPQRMGSQHPNIAPYGDIFQTKDAKTILLAVGTEKQFQQLCKSIEEEHLKTDIRFDTNAKRVTHRTELATLLQIAFLKFERKEILNRLKENAVPVAVIRNMKEVFETEVAQDMILEERLPDGTNTQRVKTAIFKIKA